MSRLVHRDSRAMDMTPYSQSIAQKQGTSPSRGEWADEQQQQQVQQVQQKQQQKQPPQHRLNGSGDRPDGESGAI